MTLRQLAQRTRPIDVDWGEQYEVSSDVVARKREIGEFFLRIGVDMSVDPRCVDGTVEGAAYYVQRWLDYHQKQPDADRFIAGLDASTLVHDIGTGHLIGVCLVGGGKDSCSVYEINVDPAYRNLGLGTRMLQRALDVLHGKGFAEMDLWRDDENPAARLYERLGFVETGQVEES